jgi:protein ImuB
VFAVVFIPNFSLQAVLRHEPELRSRAVALVDCEGPGGRTSTSRPISRSLGRGGTRASQIIELTSSARGYGVCEGLTAPQAMARCDDLIIKTRSIPQEQAATEILLQTAYAFSPNIESTAPGVCTMELKGLEVGRVTPCAPFDQRAAELWAGKILRALGSLQLEAQIGFALTPELALLAARAAKPILMLQEGRAGSPLRAAAQTQERRARSDAPCLYIESFPVTALDPSAETLDILNRWGIQTIGALLALGKDNVIERLGPEAAKLFERVSTDSIRPLKLVVPSEDFAEQMEFETEIETVEPLLFVLRRFVEQLSRRVELIYLVIAEFHLRLGLTSGANYERVFKIPSPTGKIGTLFRMLQTHLETVRTDSPIVSLRLSAKPCKPDKHQFGLFEATLRDPNQFAETLAQLTALCGSDRVGTPQLEPTHRPDAFRMKTPEFGATNVGQASRLSSDQSQVIKEITSALRTRFAGEAPALRYRGLQLRRFRPALPAQTECRERRPVLLRSPVFNGTITDARGPFFSSGNWWDQNNWSRMEWDVRANDGSLYRLVRQEEEWFVEGVYD